MIDVTRIHSFTLVPAGLDCLVDPAGRAGPTRRPPCDKEPHPMSKFDPKRLLADVEAFCEAIRPIEELCYVEHRFNDQLLPLARKYDLLAMPIPPEYGGRG